MGFVIDDGTGQSNSAKVTDDNALKIIGETHHLQHHFSRVEGQAYQLLSTTSLSASGDVSLIHVLNNSSSLLFGVTYVRLQAIGIAGLPSVNEYVSMGLNSTYQSNGVNLTPVNLNAKSGNVADVTVYNNAVTSSSIDEIDRWYLEPNGKEERYEKWGSVLLGQNDTLEIKLRTLSSSGLLKARITFVMFGEEI